jgi:DNA-binding CsgD family transcriptional regulator
MSGLTVRELEVLQLISSGLTSKEIASKLNIAFKTVAAHRANILFKTKAGNTAKLVSQAARSGLINVFERSQDGSTTVAMDERIWAAQTESLQVREELMKAVQELRELCGQVRRERGEFIEQRLTLRERMRKIRDDRVSFRQKTFHAMIGKNT